MYMVYICRLGFGLRISWVTSLDTFQACACSSGSSSSNGIGSSKDASAAIEHEMARAVQMREIQMLMDEERCSRRCQNVAQEPYTIDMS
jgi:hypothetical protein